MPNTTSTTSDSNTSLHNVFNPSSIAVVGASNTAKKPGYNLMQALSHFSGDIYPINPASNEVIHGLKSYPDLKAVGKPIDLVIFAIPARFILEVMERAEGIDIAGCMIVTSGFSETGSDGEQLQQRLESLCSARGIRVIGPNTAGFMKPAINLYASFVLELDGLKPGNVGVVSQSGAMNMVLSFLLRQSDLGVSLAIGLGNMMDIAHADIISYLADDDDTDVILIYAEGISRGRDLYDAVKYAVSRKPIVALLVGRADIEEFAASHTGNLIGSYELKKSVLEQAGAIVVDTETEAVDAAKVFSKYRLEPSASPGIGVITGQAGPGMIITDKLKEKNLDVPELTGVSIERIGSLLPPLTFIKNPVDTGRPSNTFSDILHTVCEDERIDAVVTFLLEESDTIIPEDLFGQEAKTTRTPMIFGTVGINAERINNTITDISNNGVPAYPAPERAANAAIMLALDAQRQYALAEVARTPSLPKYSIELDSTSPLDEDAAKDAINAYGISTPQRKACKTHDEARSALQTLSTPIVAKVLDALIPHKTEVGGVHLNIRSEAELELALASIDQIKGDATQRRYLLEEMAKPGTELIMGATNNPCFGPVIVLGMGGTAAEAIGDVTMRTAPVTRPEARDMIKQLRCSELLDGWRGTEPCDKEALIDSLVNLGVMIARNPRISEMDLNPVRSYPSGLNVLDALIQFDHSEN